MAPEVRRNQAHQITEQGGSHPDYSFSYGCVRSRDWGSVSVLPEQPGDGILGEKPSNPGRHYPCCLWPCHILRKGQKVTENLWTGAMTLKMENVALNAENKFFTLTSVDVTSDVHKEDAYLNSSVALTFNGVRTKNGQSPQKEIDLGMLNYRFEANKLEIASLDKLSQLFVELESHPDQYGAMIKEVTQLFSKAADNSELKASLDHQINNNGLKVELNARPWGFQNHRRTPSAPQRVAEFSSSVLCVFTG